MLFHAYDSMMFILLHIIMMRMEGTGTRDGGGKQRADAHWTGDRGDGGGADREVTEDGRRQREKEGQEKEGGGRKNGIRLNGEA